MSKVTLELETETPEDAMRLVEATFNKPWPFGEQFWGAPPADYVCSKASRRLRSDGATEVNLTYMPRENAQ